MDLHQKKDKRLLSPQEQLGSQWVFIAMCRDTKLIPAFSLDKRTTKVAALGTTEGGCAASPDRHRRISRGSDGTTEG